MEEKREQGRVRIDRRATIRLSRGLRVVVRTVEISGSGMSFRYEAPADEKAEARNLGDAGRRKAGRRGRHENYP